MSEAPLVLVLDDDDSVRQSIASLLRSVGFHVKAFASAHEVVDDACLAEASCLILDVRLSQMSGLEFHQQIRAMGLACPVVFVTGNGDIPMTVQAMKAGAADFLTKPFKNEDLLAAVTAAVGKNLEELPSHRHAEELRSRYATLTVREKEILALATGGLMNKQIAGRLGLSEVTVKIYRGKISRKMLAKSFADLVLMSEVLGLSPTAAGRNPF